MVQTIFKIAVRIGLLNRVFVIMVVVEQSATKRNKLRVTMEREEGNYILLKTTTGINKKFITREEPERRKTMTENAIKREKRWRTG